MFVKNTVVNIGSFHIAPTQPIVVITRKIKQTYSKREHFSSSPYHEPQAPTRQSATLNNSTPHHMGRSLAGHPQSVKLGSGDNKTRLYFNSLEESRDLVAWSLHRFTAATFMSCAS